MLTWAAPVNICCFLDNHSYDHSTPAYGLSTPPFECLLAVGAVHRFSASAGAAFRELAKWAAGHREWLFGHFAYPLVAETEGVDPAAGDAVGFADVSFFIPEVVIQLQKDCVSIGSFQNDHETLWQQITALTPAAPATSAPIAFTPRITREEYLSTITALQGHILRGDCYEINFCQEFFAQPVGLDALATWWALSRASPNPFAAFYRVDERWLLCASPERYLKKLGNTLYSQPMKGTAPRQQNDPLADERRREALYNSAKDRAENVMVVDLVRNDLARICRPGSVEVAELFGVYPFPQVYQMVSTIKGELLPGLDWTEAIRNSFPMGSMTGAPKNRVVRLIAQYERTRRGLFSGAVGYVTPDGDFDFNVVIRSLLYNRENKYLSYQVGSGITFYSDPQAEYEECLVKAEGIRKALGQLV